MQSFRIFSLVVMLMLAFNFLLSQTFQNEVVGSEDWRNGDLVYLNNGTFVFLSEADNVLALHTIDTCLLYTSPSPRDATLSRMPSSA